MYYIDKYIERYTNGQNNGTDYRKDSEFISYALEECENGLKSLADQFSNPYFIYCGWIEETETYSDEYENLAEYSGLLDELYREVDSSLVQDKYQKLSKLVDVLLIYSSGDKNAFYNSKFCKMVWSKSEYLYTPMFITWTEVTDAAILSYKTQYGVDPHYRAIEGLPLYWPEVCYILDEKKKKRNYHAYFIEAMDFIFDKSGYSWDGSEDLYELLYQLSNVLWLDNECTKLELSLCNRQVERADGVRISFIWGKLEDLGGIITNEWYGYDMDMFHAISCSEKDKSKVMGTYDKAVAHVKPVKERIMKLI